MVFGSFSKERFPDAGFHHQSSRPQIAFQEDTNTIETLINHGRGGGALEQQGHRSSSPSCSSLAGVWEGSLEGRVGPRWPLGTSFGFPKSLSQPVKWVHMRCLCPARLA